MMTDFVEIPDDNSSDNEVQEHQGPTTNPAFDELKSLKSEMEFRGSLLGKTWSELSKIMTRYQSQLIQKHEQLDSSLTGADHFRISQTEQELKRNRTDNDKLQKQVTDLESKILDKDTEIVRLRTEVHKFRNEVVMKDNLIQKIQGQMAQEALDYQTEITSLRDMLETGQGDYSVDLGPVPVSAPQPVKRRKVMPKPQIQRQPMTINMPSPRKPPQTLHRVPSSIASPPKSELSSVTSPMKKEPFQSSCQMAASSSNQFDQNEMDSSYLGDDQSFNESQDSNQDQGFFKVDEVYDDSNSGGVEGLLQGQDPNMLLENMPDGQDQMAIIHNSMMQSPSYSRANFNKHICSVCDKGFRTPSHLERHRLTHIGAKPYQCLLCMKTFSQKANTIGHVRKVHKRVDAELLVRDLSAL